MTTMDCQHEIDDLGQNVWWDAVDEWWVSEADEDKVSDRMRPLIEAHDEFRGWMDKCPECLAGVEFCDCEEEESDEEEEEESDEEEEEESDDDSVLSCDYRDALDDQCGEVAEAFCDNCHGGVFGCAHHIDDLCKCGQHLSVEYAKNKIITVKKSE